MTQPPSPQPPAAPPPQGQRPPARKRNKLPLIIAGAGVGLIAVIGTTVGVTIAATSDGGAPQAASSKPPSAWDLEQQAAAQEPGLDEGEIGIEPGPTPAASDIKLTPKIVDKQCFGSAGCSVSIMVKMAYGGPVLSEEETFAVTYEVQGGEDGPIIGTFEVTGKTYVEQEESLSTRSPKAKITVKVTDVEKVGL